MLNPLIKREIPLPERRLEISHIRVRPGLALTVMHLLARLENNLVKAVPLIVAVSVQHLHIVPVANWHRPLHKVLLGNLLVVPDNIVEEVEEGALSVRAKGL